MSNGEFGGIETKLNNMSYRLDSMEQKINNLTKLDLRGNFLSNETKTALKTTLSHFKKLLLY